MDAVVVREGKNLKGRALGLVLGTIGKGVLEKAFRKTIKAIEARNSDAQTSPHQPSTTAAFDARRDVGRLV